MKLVGIILLISCAFSAERDLFKTCQQSSFCRRCRTVSGPSKYEAIVDTLQTDNNGITIDLRNNENNQFFILKLKALQVRYIITKFSTALLEVLFDSRLLRTILSVSKLMKKLR